MKAPAVLSSLLFAAMATPVQAVPIDTIKAGETAPATWVSDSSWGCADSLASLLIGCVTPSLVAPEGEPPFEDAVAKRAWAAARRAPFLGYPDGTVLYDWDGAVVKDGPVLYDWDGAVVIDPPVTDEKPRASLPPITAWPGLLPPDIVPVFEAEPCRDGGVFSLCAPPVPGPDPGPGPDVPSMPEPTSVLLLGSGLLGIAGLARRQFRK